MLQVHNSTLYDLQSAPPCELHCEELRTVVVQSLTSVSTPLHSTLTAVSSEERALHPWGVARLEHVWGYEVSKGYSCNSKLVGPP